MFFHSQYTKALLFQVMSIMVKKGPLSKLGKLVVADEL